MTFVPAFGERVTLDDGTNIDVTNHADGSITKRYPDGTVVYEYPPPNPIRKQTVSPDPHGFTSTSKITVTEYYDGRIVQVRNEAVNPIVTYFPNGTIVEYQKHWMQEGFPESWSYYYPDGSQLHITTDGFRLTDIRDVPTIFNHPELEKTNTPEQISDDKAAIPSWIKQNAKWWSEGLISDRDFASGIGHLIKEKIIQVDNVDVDSAGKLEISKNLEIPNWIKQNADWWSKGSISDNDFKSGIQHLVKTDVIKISDKQTKQNTKDNSEGSILDELSSDDNTPFVINKHGSLADFACSSDLRMPTFVQVNLTWVLEGDISQGSYINILIVSPNGNSFYMSSDSVRDEGVFRVPTTLEHYPGTWRFEIDSVFDYSTNSHVRYSGDDSAIYVTIPPCPLSPDVDPPLVEPPEEQKDASGESVMDEVLDQPTLQIIDTKINSCKGGEVNGTFELRHEDGSSVGMGVNTSVIMIAKNVETGQITHDFLFASPHGNFIDFETWGLPEGTWVIYPTDVELDDTVSTPFETFLVSGNFITVETPCVSEEDASDVGIENDYSHSGQCTADSFGYGEIVVTDKWGTFNKISDEEGYELFWGWELKYKDPNSPYSTAGIIVNFDAQGPYPYEKTEWQYADDTGKLDSITWTSNPGIYTFEIIDFESIGSYCGDGDMITINVN